MLRQWPFISWHSAKEEFEQSNHSQHTPKFAFTDTEFLLRPELRPVRLQLELLRPELMLDQHHITDAIAVFGSARAIDKEKAQRELDDVKKQLEQMPNEQALQKKLKKAQNMLMHSETLEQATEFAQLVASDQQFNLVLFTGGGPGFMQATNKGAYLSGAPSVALNMHLPNEQKSNPYVPDELSFCFHYFSIRKMHFLMRARALVVFPGGFGTLDELFETLTLIQTEKMSPVPIVLYRKAYWDRIINFNALAEEGMINESDIDLWGYAETPEEAWQYIQGKLAPEREA